MLRLRREHVLSLIAFAFAAALLLVGVLNAGSTDGSARPIQSSYGGGSGSVAGSSASALATTGSDDTPVLVLLGAGLVAAGTASLVLTRRRSSASLRA